MSDTKIDNFKDLNPKQKKMVIIIGVLFLAFFAFAQQSKRQESNEFIEALSNDKVVESECIMKSARREGIRRNQKYYLDLECNEKSIPLPIEYHELNSLMGTGFMEKKIIVEHHKRIGCIRKAYNNDLNIEIKIGTIISKQYCYSIHKQGD